MNSIGKSSRLLSAAILSTLFASGAYAQQRTFDLPEQEAVKSIPEFARQAGIQISAPTEELKGLHTPQIQGELDVRAALEKLIEKTGLEIASDDGGMVILRKADLVPAQESAGRVDGSRVNLARFRAQGGLSPATLTSSQEAAKTQSSSLRTGAIQEVRLEEVLVTGSHIRGAQNLSSPIITFDRDEIVRAGHSTVQDVIQSLPQNLNSISDSTFGAVNGGIDSATYDGSGPNLRGLGGDSTLVLLNGRRLPAAGQGEFADVSMIPLSAIERIEVLTDGASAIYGSDAVGGVVNLVLRDDVDAAETTLRYGTVTEGNYDEKQAAQMFGGGWGFGQAIVSYEYYRQNRLGSADRDFIDKSVYSDLELIPEQRRQSVLATLSQRLSDRSEISADVLYSQRESGAAYAIDGLPPLQREAKVQQYGGSLQLSVDLENGWEGRVSGTLARNESNGRQFWVDSGEANQTNSNESKLWSADVAAEGAIGMLPGGGLRLAVGGQFRKEQFEESQPDIPAKLDRDVSAAYLELHAPLIGGDNRLSGMEHLTITLAGRYEEYSDFGSTFNPKIGVAWSPMLGMNVRGTWGTSFKAPLLSQMNPADSWGYIYLDTLLDTDGTTTGLILSGTGVDLGPQESTNWTAGFDLAPVRLPGLEVSATYFSIDYSERIRSPLPRGYRQSRILLDPQYARLVNRNTDPALVAALLGGRRSYCYTADGMPCSFPPLESVAVIVDLRETNLASVSVSGIDLASSYRWHSSFGSWGIHLSGSYLLSNRERFAPGSPQTDQINDVYRPVDLRVRSGISLSRGAMNASIIFKYVDDYRDKQAPGWNGPRQRSTVASWTTVDFTLQYDLGKLLNRSGNGATTLTLSALNLLDRDPPFVSHMYGLNFDGVNANPLGRFISAQVTAQW